jgi:hypothetical protein
MTQVVVLTPVLERETFHSKAMNLEKFDEATKLQSKLKRSANEAFGEMSQPASSPFIPMFERIRIELDEHHNRRERIVKASRDITAASKKM